MKVAEKVVTKTVGNKTRNATPAAKTVQITATSTPMRSVAMSVKRKTDMLNVMNRSRGKPLIAI